MLPERLFLTEHAVRRYHRRWRPQMKLGAAKAELEAALSLATFHELNDSRSYLYRIPCGALLTVAHDGAVRTVLPMGAKKKIYRPKKRRRA